MGKIEVDSGCGRILVVCHPETIRDIHILILIESLKAEYSLRICILSSDGIDDKVISDTDGWRTNLPERVLEDVDLVLLMGMSEKTITFMETGNLQNAEVMLFTQCFLDRIPVYLWEDERWAEAVFLPEPVRKFRERQKAVCDKYNIIFDKSHKFNKKMPCAEHTGNILTKGEPTVREIHPIYTMEDVIHWTNREVIPKEAHFTPLAADYIRENKIDIEYER